MGRVGPTPDEPRRHGLHETLHPNARALKNEATTLGSFSRKPRSEEAQ